MTGYAIEETLINTKPAKIVLGTLDAGTATQSYVISLYVTDLVTSTASRPPSLSITGRVSKIDQQALVRHMFTTIRFDIRQ